jgi:hypothetical protein
MRSEGPFRLSSSLSGLLFLCVTTPIASAARISRHKRAASPLRESFGSKEGSSQGIAEAETPVAVLYKERLQRKSKYLGSDCSCKWEKKAKTFSDAVARVSSELAACKGGRKTEDNDIGTTSTKAAISYASGKSLNTAIAGKQADFLIQAVMKGGKPR